MDTKYERTVRSLEVQYFGSIRKFNLKDERWKYLWIEIGLQLLWSKAWHFAQRIEWNRGDLRNDMNDMRNEIESVVQVIKNLNFLESQRSTKKFLYPTCSHFRKLFEQRWKNPFFLAVITHVYLVMVVMVWKMLLRKRTCLSQQQHNSKWLLCSEMKKLDIDFWLRSFILLMTMKIDTFWHPLWQINSYFVTLVMIAKNETVLVVTSFD